MQILINNNEFTNKTVNAEINNTLNEINKAEINITATNAFERNLLSIDNELTFIDNNNKTLKFIIVNDALTENNSIKLICRGIEEVFANEKVDISSLTNASVKRTRNATYNNVSFTNIINDLIAPFSSWSLSTTITATIGNYRVNDDQSYWNAIAKLCNEQAYEIDVDYINKEILIEENLGNIQVATLNEDMDFEGTPTYTRERAKGKKVIVYGKGDGDFQIKATAIDASYSIGQPVIKIYDSNIVTNSQAQTRANNELTKLKQNIKHYIIPQLTKNFELNVSDTIILNSESVFIENEELKIVRVIYSIQGDTQFKSIEVTNAEYSRAFKTAQQRINEQNLLLQENNTNMQGSGNLHIPQGELNCTSTAPLRLPLNISNYTDDSGNIRIQSFKLDVDIDPFRRGAGTATATSDLKVANSSSNEDANISNNSGTTEPSVTGNTATNSSDVNVLSFDSNAIVVGSFGSNIAQLSRSFPSVSPSRDWTLISFYVSANRDFSPSSTGGFDIEITTNGTPSTLIDKRVCANYPSWNATYVVKGGSFMSATIINKDIGTETVAYGYTINSIGTHSHGDGSLAAANHSHNDGTYIADNHSHGDGSYDIPISELSSITIGDDVSDANSVNATGFDWELYELVSGTLTLRNSGTETFGSETFINDIDISDSGTYPNSTNRWEVWVTPNSTNADLVKAKMNIKHEVENN